jgi:hypothetical protein
MRGSSARFALFFNIIIVYFLKHLLTNMLTSKAAFRQTIVDAATTDAAGILLHIGASGRMCN